MKKKIAMSPTQLQSIHLQTGVPMRFLTQAASQIKLVAPNATKHENAIDAYHVLFDTDRDPQSQTLLVLVRDIVLSTTA